MTHDTFGENIDISTTDLLRKKGLGLTDLVQLDDLELASVKIRDIWPRLDYLKLVQNGTSRECALFIHHIYRACEPSPLFPDRTDVESYVLFVRSLQTVCNQLARTNDIEFFTNPLKHIRLENNSEYTLNFEHYNAPIDKFLTQLSASGGLQVLRSQIALTDFPYNNTVSALFNYYIAPHETGYAVYALRSGRPYTLKGYYGHPTEADAIQFLHSKFPLKPRRQASKPHDTPSDRKPVYDLSSVIRTGIDYRKGANVTTDDLIHILKLRGGTWGEWKDPVQRQLCLNLLFDSFCDLACLLDFPLTALTHIARDTRLGIRFGEPREQGVVAFYNPFHNIVGLTPDRISGLGHELGHFIDRELGYACGYMEDYLSAVSHKPTNKHPEIARHMRRIMAFIKHSKFLNRSISKDFMAGSLYYTEPCEVFAYCFGIYIHERSQGANPYLSTDNAHAPMYKERAELNTLMHELLSIVRKELLQGKGFDPGSIVLYNQVKPRYNVKIETLRDFHVYLAQTPVPKFKKKSIVQDITQALHNYGYTLHTTSLPGIVREGKSKAYSVLGRKILIDQKASRPKQIQALIEVYVILLGTSKGGQFAYPLYIEGATYTLCKYAGLDVRNYCCSDQFVELIKDKTAPKSYLRMIEQYFI